MSAGTEPLPQDKVWLLLARMADCLCVELETSPGGKPCFCGVVPGLTVPMDFCDCVEGGQCGMGWVRLAAIVPSTRFPSQATEARNCRVPLAVQIQVGATRCLPGPNADGQPPDEIAQAEAVRIQSGDMFAIRRAVECCVGTDRLTQYILGQYLPIGPAGNCGGGAWTVTVQVM